MNNSKDIVCSVLSSGIITQEELQKEKSLGAKKTSEKDIIWGLLNKKLLESMGTSDWGKMRAIYSEMAIFLKKEGKDSLQMVRESHRSQLNQFKWCGIQKAEILTCREDSCINCRKLEGKILDIDTALETMPLPVLNCISEQCAWHGGRCRCTYVAVFD